MSAFFLNIVNMSISASWIVLAVLLLRLLLKKAPKWITVLLWGIVAVRLICPFTIESVMSLIPSAETISPQVLIENPEINTGFPILNNTINPIIQESTVIVAPEKSINSLQLFVLIFSKVWVIGIAAMLLYTVISYFKVKRKIGTAVLLRDYIFQSENVVSPFVLGIIKPKIYLPFNMNEQDMEHVIAHENAHIHRKDHWWKPFGFLVLTLHWFNPLMWLGYVLLCRDIELACDEKVVKEFNNEQKADYSQALLTCSVNRRVIAACPLAFGEVGVKGRVKSVLNYKKPAFWIIIAAVVACVALAVCFLTNPPQKQEDKSMSPYGDIYTDYEGVYITIKSIDKDEGGQNIFNIVWHNETDKEITYGEMYTIEYKSGEEWIDTDFDEERYFATIGYSLKKNKTVLKSYTSEHLDISKSGTYRFMVPFSVKEGDKYVSYKAWAEFTVGSIPTTDSLREKYPEFFGLNAEDGLTVYIWQMSNDNYSCYLANTSMEAISDNSFAYEVGATIPEMRAILTTYDIDQKDITVQPVINPLSSYYYEIDDTYRANIKELFWATILYADSSQYSTIIDTANFDIDGDGKEEQCAISAGPASGLFTFIFSVSENGNLEYFNIFNSPYTELKFEKNAEGKMLLVGKSGEKTCYMGMDISDGNIVLSSDEQEVSYWGEQGLNSPYAPKTASDLNNAIAKVLNEKYQAQKPDGLIHIENYYLLAHETASGTPLKGNSGHMNIANVYLLVYHMKYSVNGDQIEEVSGDFVPTAITFSIDENGEYTLKEYWTPKTGANYEKDVRSKFPGESADNALNTEKYAEDLIKESWRMANEAFNRTKA